ncbi:MAG TPA: PAS domain-containing protein [Dongiaceae bacterium]|jgi:PAS domain S-box-containing protein|nr:PAS domain-containing protein [Dongiaceae bacterium]
MAIDRTLTGQERFFDENEVIVSKTDLKGRITYANRVFMRVAGLDVPHALEAPHSIIRHPDMPRCVFAVLWDTIQAGREIFAYVVNRAMNGDHYWVFAHVTPSYDAQGTIIGYHSHRRRPRREPIEQVIKPIYAELLAVENSYENRKEGMQAGIAALTAKLQAAKVSYDEFIFSI